jgi:hypothetical protein
MPFTGDTIIQFHSAVLRGYCGTDTSARRSNRNHGRNNAAKSRIRPLRPDQRALTITLAQITLVSV